ncbi:uncharacterized protein LODBEIA_P40230 [Lodderomyces beijingensis]|uniref:Fe2OG dioxygenase domain-containing protein n=1 Tax=Lodderomyces beijingensis TaxID=1775926 RepID=A0ABP0ZPF6_9ASCO
MTTAAKRATSCNHDDEGETQSNSKKRTNTAFSKEDISSFFNHKVWNTKFQDSVKDQVSHSSPYKWGTIKNLMDDTLLRQVRKEVLSEIAFTKKETDIYKVYQSGDLANLSGLDWDDLSRLPSLYKLRAAIYSQEFRDVISKITGCGKLSGVKTDMSVNTYTKGCHLLTHDDVIGSRRVSFILYLPEPDKVWKPQYGGALRLFPAVVPNVPHTDHECKLVPQFNQIAFFTVQPGLSFHDVEEVREDRHRLSIQGWFHIPQPGEDGFVEGEQEKTEALSTLKQLQSKELQNYDSPKNVRSDVSKDNLQLIESCDKLSQSDVEYLRKYLNPVYLEKDVVYKKLTEAFIEDSFVEINEVLNNEFAASLRRLLRDEEINKPTPQHSSQVQNPWSVAVPPHKQRFLYIEHPHPQAAQLPQTQTETSSADTKLLELAAFLASTEFKKWLKLITELVPTSENILIRRFRPGNDFILATTTESQVARENSEDENVLLEATLNLTPTADNRSNWSSGEFGGYELCMMQPGNDKDKDKNKGGEGGKGEDGEEEDEADDPAIYRSSKGDDDDSMLYTSQCKWNSLTLMVRDPSILKFVKYVSINAKGSRWDISCQWNVKSLEEEDEEDEDENENENETK